MYCLDLTKDLEAILGDQIASRKITPEADEVDQKQVQQQQLS
jgi:hypothetical protein